MKTVNSKIVMITGCNKGVGLGIFRNLAKRI